MINWTTSDIPSQCGRTAVVTGTGGLGFEDALALARVGAKVVLAGRDRAKGEGAVRRILQSAAGADVCFEELDLSILQSIAAFTERSRHSLDKIDILINNAGVMAPPTRRMTADGFEMQLGTNYLGHFALTAQLLPLLLKADRPRVVSVSSIAARQGELNFDDLQSALSYKPMQAYGQSKLACLIFALELQRRSDAAGWGIVSIAAHPGVSRTDLILNGSGEASAAGMARRLLWFLFQPVAQGALPTLFAATSAQAKQGGYYGPDKLGELRGHPAPAKVPPKALDMVAARRLWTESERLVAMPFAAPSVTGDRSRG